MKCKICGCDEEHPCIKNNGEPCAWVDKNLCDACIVVLSPEESKDSVSLIIPKMCRTCFFLQAVAPLGFTCSHGYYNVNNIPTYYAASGIDTPNKAVALAQRHCPDFFPHERFFK